MSPAVTWERPSSRITRFTGCQRVQGDDLRETDIWFSTATGKIVNSQEVFYDQQVAPDSVIDLGNRIVCPGFIDVQFNGAFGFDFSRPTTDIQSYIKSFRGLNRGLARTGVTSYLPTVTSSKPEVYHSVLPCLGPSGSIRVAEDGAESLGAHCEGPFISPTKNGIHSTDVLRSAPNGLKDLVDCYGQDSLSTNEHSSQQSPVKMITAAPELEGILASIPAIVSGGTIFAIGHTEADFSTASQAISAGATMITHLFNAMKPLHHRNPGVFGTLGQASNCLLYTSPSPRD